MGKRVDGKLKKKWGSIFLKYTIFLVYTIHSYILCLYNEHNNNCIDIVYTIFYDIMNDVHIWTCYYENYVLLSILN